MTECIIVIRNPRNNRIIIVDDDDGNGPAVFPDRDAAIDCAFNHQPLCRAGFPYQIVELDEL
jgi:hypothetical protein